MNSRKEIDKMVKIQEINKYQEKFFDKLKKAENIKAETRGLKTGVWEFEVKERLFVGEYSLSLPAVAIVIDTQDRIFAVPEDSTRYTLKNSLVSRWDVRSGMKLRLTVDEEGIPEVLIL